MYKTLVLAAGLATLSACAPAMEEVTVPVPEALPVMAWDHRPGSDEWTEAAIDALTTHGAELLSQTPEDIERWCPGYAEADIETRAAFWSGLFSILAFYESTWNPRAVGGGGLWFGLVQIDPRTARAYDCEASTGEALKDGAANLNCAVRIATHQVLRRGTVSRGMRDWGPFHSESRRASMRNWTNEQSYCEPVAEEADGVLSSLLPE